MNIQLSASSLTTFLRCGRQWYYAYVLGEKSPPTLKQARGIAVHKAVEVNMEQKVSSHEDVPIDDMLDAFSASWDEVGQDGFEHDEQETPGDAKDAGYALTRLHHKEVSPTIQPVWVEKPVQFKLNDNIVWTGQIDLADEMGRIRDTKTTSRRPKPEQYLINMTGYSCGARQLTGEVETDVVLDYMVNTKTPYYLPIAVGGPVSDDSIRRFVSIAEGVAATIEAGNYPANGVQNGACSWCGYRSMCDYALKE
jgi:hypothetical protein